MVATFERKKKAEKKAKVLKEKKGKKEAKAPEKITFMEVPFDSKQKVFFTKEERELEGEKVCRLLKQIAEKESEASSINKRYKSEIETMECELETSRSRYEDKFDVKDVRCLRRLDWVTGMVTETRTDTGEVIQERTMSVAETQMQMKLEDEKKDKEQKAEDKKKETTEPDEETAPSTPPKEPITDDELKAAWAIIKETGRANSSGLIRKMKINAQKALDILDIFEERGLVGPPKENGDPRDILVYMKAEENTSGE